GLTRRGKQHRRPRFSSTHNVKHPRTISQGHTSSTGSSAASVPARKPPRLRRGGDIAPDLFPVNRLFPPNPQAFARDFWPKTPHLRTQGWIRKANAAVGRNGPYTPGKLDLQHRFSRFERKGRFRRGS